VRRRGLLGRRPLSGGDEPARLVGRGHPAGDVVDAWQWTLLERTSQRLRVRAVLPERMRNPRGDLFGGFAPAYLDFLAILLFQGARAPHEPTGRLVTARLSTDFFEPLRESHFEIAAELLHRTGRRGHVEARFLDASGRLCILGHATVVRQLAE
jgi:acyl-coenzyme A thioesterase PaaI-like protein